MPNLRSFYPKDTVLYISSSTEEGLPFIPNSVINPILQGFIARAQDLFGQEICHFVMMANHFHLILKVTDPDHVSSFIGYIKSNSARAINRLLGRDKKTIWCDGFDSPIILDSEKAIEKIVYIYANPTKARLVDKIEQYPGISSWHAFTRGKTTRKVRWIKISTITPLPSPDMTHTEQLNYIQKLVSRKENKKFFPLTISPNAWMSVFQELKDTPIKETNQRITKEVRKREAEYCALGAPAMGAAKLRKQPLNLTHTRKTKGMKTICLSSIEEMVTSVVSWFKDESKRAREIFQQAKYHNLKFPLPSGFFSPGGIVHSNFFDFMGWVWA